MKKKRCAIYVRVSTSNQCVKNQESVLKEYCERRDYEIFRIYRDEGISGTCEQRPGLDKMMVDAQRGKFDALICWAIDRVARSTIHLLRILNQLSELNIFFTSYTQGIETGSAVGKMLVTFLGAVAELEVTLIRERTLAGIRRAQAEGKHCGRPRVAYDMAVAIQLRQNGWGFRRIGKKLGVSHMTIQRGLHAVTKAQLEKSHN